MTDAVTALSEGSSVEMSISNNLIHFDKLRMKLVTMKAGLDKRRLSRHIREQYLVRRR